MNGGPALKASNSSILCYVSPFMQALKERAVFSSLRFNYQTFSEAPGF